jgi:hypothetical protein
VFNLHLLIFSANTLCFVSYYYGSFKLSFRNVAEALIEGEILFAAETANEFRRNVQTGSRTQQKLLRSGY